MKMVQLLVTAPLVLQFRAKTLDVEMYAVSKNIHPIYSRYIYSISINHLCTYFISTRFALFVFNVQQDNLKLFFGTPFLAISGSSYTDGVAMKLGWGCRVKVGRVWNDTMSIRLEASAFQPVPLRTQIVKRKSCQRTSCTVYVTALDLRRRRWILWNLGLNDWTTEQVVVVVVVVSHWGICFLEFYSLTKKREIAKDLTTVLVLISSDTLMNLPFSKSLQASTDFFAV